ncbi:MAG: exodeoxyribonuclease VII large subunit [Cyclobacteriaceae bacterium]
MQHVSLYELNQQIKSVLSSQLEPTYWVVAEIGEMRVGQNGHCYLDLIEKNGDYLYAKIRATIWSNAYRGLGAWFESITGEQLRPGLKILTQVEVKFHHLYGLSLNIKDIDAQFTLGERALKRQEVINQLLEDGVFEMNKGLALPVVPQKIAVISSPTAAGLGDFIDQLQGNGYGYQYQVQLYKAKMQGNDAEESIIQALHQIFQHHEQQNNRFDAVVIIRGGGAQVDLDCFDGYDVAAHIAQFPLPVISGIGHERDETVVDLVAHTRMKTPTAVAEFLINRAAQFEGALDELARRMIQVSEQILNNQQYRLERLQSSLKLSVVSQNIRQQHYLDQKQQQLKQGAFRRLQYRQDQLNTFLTVLQKNPQRQVREQYQRLKSIQTLMEMVDPEMVLRRGFSITYVEGKPIKPTATLKTGDQIVTKTAEATYLSSLQQIIKSENAQKEVRRTPELPDRDG